MPELGSRLYLVLREKPAARQALAEQYVAEALAGESGLRVTEVSLAQEGDRGLLTVRLDWQGAAGQEITLRFAEALTPDGSLYTATCAPPRPPIPLCAAAAGYVCPPLHLPRLPLCLDCRHGRQPAA